MDTMVSDKDLTDIARKIKLTQNQLHHLFVQLGIEQADVENAERSSDKLDFKLQAIEVLKSWRQSLGRRASRKTIIEALEEINMVLAKEKLLRRWSRVSDKEIYVLNDLQRTAQPSSDGDAEVASQETESEAGQSHSYSHKKKKKKTRKARSRESENKSSKSLSKEEEDILNSIPNASFQCLKYEVCEVISEHDLKKLKAICSEDLKRRGMKKEQLDTVKTPEEFFNELQRCHLFGEDNLFFVQWCLLKVQNITAYKIIGTYAKEREETMRTEPLVLRKKKGKQVDIRIRGKISHMRMSDVNAFTATISQRLGIPKENIAVKGVAHGSVILVLLMSELGINRLRNAVGSKESWLYDEKVLDVKIAGEDSIKLQGKVSQSERKTQCSAHSTSSKQESSYIKEMMSKMDELKNTAQLQENIKAHVSTRHSQEDISESSEGVINSKSTNAGDTTDCMPKQEDCKGITGFEIIKMFYDTCITAMTNVFEPTERRSKQKPLIMKGIKRKAGEGSKFVEFRIEGDCKRAKMDDASKLKKTVSETLDIPQQNINVVGIGKG